MLIQKLAAALGAATLLATTSAASAAPEHAGPQAAGRMGRICTVRRTRLVPGGSAAGSGTPARRAMKRTCLDSSVLIQADVNSLIGVKKHVFSLQSLLKTKDYENNKHLFVRF